MEGTDASAGGQSRNMSPRSQNRISVILHSPPEGSHLERNRRLRMPMFVRIADENALNDLQNWEGEEETWFRFSDYLVETALCLTVKMAGATGREPAASCVTVRRSNLSAAASANVSQNSRAKGCALGRKKRMRVSEVFDRPAF